MYIRKFRIELSSLTEGDLEQVLVWRNDPEVQRYMLHQEEITPEGHRAWFETLGEYHHYLMIRSEGQPIGVINIRDIDLESRNAEAGIFIGAEEYRHSFVPMLSILALMDVCFEQLRMTELWARVRKDNVVALRMNEDLGYRLADMYDDAYHMRVERKDYLAKRKRFQTILEKFQSEEEVLELSPAESAFFRPVK